MAQQKLYTEEQVTYAIGVAFDVEPPCKVKDILRDLTPIELPSDEEIDDYARFESENEEKDYTDNLISNSTYLGIVIGAKWMRDKILNK